MSNLYLLTLIRTVELSDASVPDEAQQRQHLGAGEQLQDHRLMMARGGDDRAG